VILQAAGLALLAALSPTALLVGAVYLGSARPRLVGSLYLAGAILMSLVMGLVVIAILRNTGLSHRSEHAPRYGLRLGLGVLMLAAGLVLSRRKPKLPDPEHAKQGIVSRMIANPAPLSAFAVGLLLFAPGITFIAALQVIATARASFEQISELEPDLASLPRFVSDLVRVIARRRTLCVTKMGIRDLFVI